MTTVIRSLGRRSSVILLAAVAGIGVFSAPSASAGFRIGIDIKSSDQPKHLQMERVWISPVYHTECARVWVEPVYRCVEEQVWVPERCEDRWVVRHHGWHEHRERVHIVLEPGHWEKRSRQVLVRSGRWEERSRQVLVTPGHWGTHEVCRDDVRGRHEHGQVSVEIDRRW